MAVYLLTAIIVNAQEETPVTIPVEQIIVNQEEGTFSFIIEVNTNEAYAGMEFGMVCGSGCEITSVDYDRNINSTGPANSDMIWFGFFDGEDSFTEPITVTVSGTCQKDSDSELALKMVKKYTIGEQQYEEEDYLVDMKVNLSSTKEAVSGEVIQCENEEVPLAVAKSKDVGIPWPIILGLLGLAVIGGVLIHKFLGLRKAEKEKNYEKKQEFPKS